MRSETRELTVAGPSGLHLYVWRPDQDGPPKAVLQLVHGMAEHAGRYARVAQALTDAGYWVYAVDQRGHGLSVRSPEELGFIAERGGWDLLVDDQLHVNAEIGALHPGCPRVIFGHSMGSFVTQHYLLRHGASVAGAVLSGTNSGAGKLARVALGVAHVERLRLGARATSAVLQRLSFGDYNRKFAPVRTEYDWLSRDEAEVDRYIADPLCGFDFSIAGWMDVFHGLIGQDRPEGRAQIPKTLPVYVFAGDRDPVGGAGKGPRLLVQAYERAGIEDVTQRLYAGGRHEMLNETNREEVARDLVAWLAARWP